MIELLVVVAIISVLVAMLLPAMYAVRRQAENVHCASNQRQIGQAILVYVGANRGWLPFNDQYGDMVYRNAANWYSAYSWPNHYTGLGLLYKCGLLPSSDALACPSTHRKVPYGTLGISFEKGTSDRFTTYWYRIGMYQPPSVVSGVAFWGYSSQQITTIKYPDDGLVFCGARNGYGGINVSQTFDPHELHSDQGFNILTLDGSVGWFSSTLHPHFNNTQYPQCGQAVGSPNAPSDTYGNVYRPDMAWRTMRRAALVYHDVWTNPQSNPAAPGVFATSYQK